MIGYVYIMINAAFPNLIKIGRTTKSSDERAVELYTTGTPGKFIVVYDVLVDDCVDIEKQMHELIADKRYAENREFFHASSKEAIEILQRISKNRIVENNNENLQSTENSSLFQNNLGRFYFYGIFLGNINPKNYDDYRSDRSIVYRFGLIIVDQVDEIEESFDNKVTPIIKLKLKSELLGYYQAFDPFYKNYPINFIGIFGENNGSELLYELEFPLLNKSYRNKLEKIIQDSIVEYTSTEHSALKWENIFDEQTLRCTDSQNRALYNHSEAIHIYFNAYTKLNEFCKLNHENYLNQKAVDKIQDIKLNLKGNF